MKLGLIDEIIPEPLGGAHRSIHDTVYNVEQYITRTLRELKRMKIENLLEARYKKLRAIGEGNYTMDTKRPQKIAKPKLPKRLSVAQQLDQVKDEAEKVLSE
jgi:hypothetical protein